MSAPSRVPDATSPDGPRGEGRVTRLCRAIGLASAPPATRWLLTVLIPTTLAAITVGLVLGWSEGMPAQPRWLPIAAVAVGIAQLARLTFRIASGTFSVAWGEAALIVCLYTVPPMWVPAVVGAGALGAHLLLLAMGRWRTLADAVRNAAAITLSGTVGMAIALAVAPTYFARFEPVTALALAAGAAGYYVVTVALVSVHGAARGSDRFSTVFAQTLRIKLIMVIGNIMIGLLLIAIIGANRLWALLLPPVLWLLQQTYGHRLRAEEERRTWRAFMGATQALNQLDEPSVAREGVNGAMALFAPLRAEVRVCRPVAGYRSYICTRGGAVVESVEARHDGDRSADQASRPLMVNHVMVGELRLWFSDSLGLTARQEMALSAYADALASALHDAATHHQLQGVTSRSKFDSSHDPLTGLANRATLLMKGDATLRERDRDTPVALLLLDINHFKEVNDTLGHAAGDELLRTVAARLRDLTGEDELLARLGGDEFALLMPDTMGEVQPAAASGESLSSRRAMRRARRIIEVLAVPTEVSGLQLSVEVSVGVVVAPAGSADMSELLRRADIAMYQAKRGGPAVAWYDSAKDAASTDRLALLAELREALSATDQLYLAMQPAVDLATGAPSGVEALVRWRHPRRGLLVPADFVRAVEVSELLGPFTRFVIDNALAIVAGWAAEGLVVPVSVNMSPRSLLDPRLPADVAELLRRHRVPPSRLILEITETVVMSELEVIDEVLEGLRSMGVQLAVDDFGTGYSSLTFLTRIRVDEVKVDRTFVGKMVDSPEAAAIVRTTVDLGKELGLRVVAEGVETGEQRTLLASMGCAAAQGFHFCPPMPPDKVAPVLRALSTAAGQGRVIPLRADGA